MSEGKSVGKDIHFMFLLKTQIKNKIKLSSLYSTSGDLAAIIAIFHKLLLSLGEVTQNI
ncbi:hypothetical protein XBKB1_2500002 [Xenorhabdus bovienii str. kraussei Becker Underwood]|uniref:Uncharacterized protein n=1 Tax=Xenorhabdus bovienii str. kraussei Becker Underwood TaxID=1398204 RepID=A0A077PT62_XENBV|nr:hypothetical protein XBKB1_2500002 [Xenorhabdus bovienii str. kraussei Becker Underwood]